MEHQGLIFLAVLGFLLVAVDASSPPLQASSKERSVIYQADNFKCPFVFGTFSDPTDCAHFYVCVGGMAVRKKCKAFMHFDTLRRRCLPAFIAICGGGDEDKTKSPTDKPPVTDPTTTTTKSGGNKFSCPSFFGTYPHPDDCSKYYTCSFYQSTLNTCPENKLFDAVKKECKPEKKVNCGDRERPLGLLTTELPTEPPTETVTEVETDKEVTDEETTPEDITTITDFPTGPPEHDCKDGDLDCIIDETGDVDKWFICPQDVGSFPHPSSDHLFIFCMNWIPSAKKCGQNLVFSNELSTCVEVKVEEEEE